MAAIVENTTVRLMFWPTADISHQNVCFFASESARDSAFNNLAHTTGTETEGFVFISENKVRVPYLITNIQGYNYLFYRNPAWDGTQKGTHRMYAFIIDMKYINNKTTEITFEIDYWTTYHPFINFYSLAFIERCHPSSDQYMANQEGEPIDVGLVTHAYEQANAIIDPLSSGHINLCVLTTFEDFSDPPSGAPIRPATPVFANDHTASMLKIWRWDITADGGAQSVRNWFANLSTPNMSEYQKGIVDCYLAPVGAQGVKEFDPGYGSRFKTIARPTGFGFGDGAPLYTARWQKTLQYPYMYCQAAASGNIQEYQFELSSESRHNLRFYHTATDYGGNVSIMGVPYNYRGYQYRVPEAISLNGFPHVAWCSDSFAQWLNENGTKQTINGVMGAVAMLGGAAAVAGGIATANPVMAYGGATAALGGASTLANLSENYRIAASQPPSMHGTPDANLLFNTGHFNIVYAAMGCTPNHAKKIDEFFDRYGYATNATLTLRNFFFTNSNNSHFGGSYIKTKNYSAQGGSSYFVPAKALNYVSACFNRGITIWPNLTMG